MKKLWIVIGVVAIAIIGMVFIAIYTKKEPEEIKFGATFPLTGDVASYGQKAKRGIELAVEKINDEGGLLEKKVTVDFQDDRNDKKDAVSIVTKFVSVDRVPVIFGSAGSTVTLAITHIVNRNKVILISPISSSTKLSTEGGMYFFRTCPADDLQAEILAGWVTSYGAKNVAIVYTNNSWGKPLAEGFTDEFIALGGKVLLSEGVEEGATDFRSVIAKLKGLENLEAVISPTYPKEGGVFVRQVKEGGLRVPLFGGDNWGSPEYLTAAQDAAEGVYYTAPAQGGTLAYADFAKEYKEKYAEEPDVFGGYAYDAATAIFKAIEYCGCTEPIKIRESLLNLSFLGVSGNVAFKSNGDLKSEAFAKKTIRNGKAIDVE